MSSDGAGAPAAPPAIFTQTGRMREAVALINALAVKRMPLILNRIITHLKDKTSEIFNEDELSQLCDLLSLSPAQAQTLLDSLSYIYQQSAYHLLSAEKLRVQMADVLQVAEQQSNAIAFVWNEQREAFMNNLRERSFGLPQVLDSVHYRSQVTMGTDALSKRKDIHTILSLGLKSESGGATAETVAPVCVELSPQGLQNLYDTLEKIQGQLDALSDKPQ